MGDGVGPVDARWVEDHDLHAVPLGQYQLLGVLLGALVGRALRVVGQHGLVEAVAGVGVEDVVGRGVDEAANAGALGGCGHLSAAHGVHPVEDRLVSDPLLRHAHRVEGQLASLGGRGEALGIGDVASDRLDAGRENARSALGVADQRAHLIAPVQEGRGDRVTDLPCCACDEGPHRLILWGAAFGVSARFTR